jgi:hypothetical protein
MEEESIRTTRRHQRRVLAWALQRLGLEEAGNPAREPSPLPPAEAQAVVAAIARAAAIARNVRDQAFARLAFPWRYESLPPGPFPPLADDEVEALTGDLEARYQSTLDDDPESDRDWSDWTLLADPSDESPAIDTEGGVHEP